VCSVKKNFSNKLVYSKQLALLYLYSPATYHKDTQHASKTAVLSIIYV
jgi:hypothetical protein